MPWTAADAKRHTHRADTDKKRRQWAAIANSSLKEHGDEGRAIRAANAAVGKVLMFCDCVKDATAQSVHTVTAIGNARGRRRQDRKRRDFDTAMAETDEWAAAKKPDQSLKPDDQSGDIVKWRLPLDIRKADAEQQLIFGWASVVEKNGQAIIDKQGDIIPVEELENAAYEFTLNSRDGGDMHARRGVAKLVESMVFTAEKQKTLGIDLGQVGWWVGFKVHDPDLWAAHKRGERPEFSIGGAALPVEVVDKRGAGRRHSRFPVRY